jgi:lysophospholipid acyltransferase (LPLAT)-like uncharacterized protein
MRALKRLTQSESVQNALAWTCACYLRCVYFFTHFEKENFKLPQSYIDSSQPFITCFWHNRLMMLPYAWPGGRTFHMLISSHRDGKLISKVVAFFGIQTIAGSSKRDGTSALKRMITVLKAGGTVGITPDGPRGPCEIVKPGLIQAAYLAKADIIPVSYSTSHRKILSSWDRFLCPFPSRRGILIWGDAIKPPQSNTPEEFEKKRLAVETALISLSKKADQKVLGS